MIVWVVAESRFEWYEILHICKDKETALGFFEEHRLKMIREVEHMIQYEKEEGYYSKGTCSWESDLQMLIDLSPGDSCRCDHPDLREWVIT